MNVTNVTGSTAIRLSRRCFVCQTNNPQRELSQSLITDQITINLILPSYLIRVEKEIFSFEKIKRFMCAAHPLTYTQTQIRKNSHTGFTLTDLPAYTIAIRPCPCLCVGIIGVHGS